MLAEREAILRVGRTLRDEHSPTHDWAQGVGDLMAAIRARKPDAAETED